MKRKILFFHIEFPIGGAERVTIDVSNYISAFDYEVYVLTHHARETDFRNIKVIEAPEKYDIDSLENANLIVRTIHDLSIDVFVMPIHVLSHMAYIKSNTCCKLVFSLHSIPFWEVTCGLYNKKKRIGNSFFKKVIWTMLTYPKTMWIKKYDRSIIEKHKLMYEQVDAYTVLCEDYKWVLLKAIGVLSDENKVRVIYNSEKVVVDANLSKKKQILFVGRMNYEDKRVDRLVDIWAAIYKKVPDWELVLVGDGPEKEILQNKVQKKKIQRINFSGYSNSVQSYYRDASVLCLTSTFEGWGLCLTEAQAHGVVPIAFDCSAGVHEVLAPSGVNGILIPPFKKKVYAALLLDLLNSPDRLHEMQQNVLLKSKEYSVEIVGKRWLALFDSLCDNRNDIDV